jgi:hypothetical protein
MHPGGRRATCHGEMLKGMKRRVCNAILIGSSSWNLSAAARLQWWGFSCRAANQRTMNVTQAKQPHGQGLAKPSPFT